MSNTDVPNNLPNMPAASLRPREQRLGLGMGRSAEGALRLCGKVTGHGPEAIERRCIQLGNEWRDGSGTGDARQLCSGM